MTRQKRWSSRCSRPHANFVTLPGLHVLPARRAGRVALAVLEAHVAVLDAAIRTPILARDFQGVRLRGGLGRADVVARVQLRPRSLDCRRREEGAADGRVAVVRVTGGRDAVAAVDLGAAGVIRVDSAIALTATGQRRGVLSAQPQHTAFTRLVCTLPSKRSSRAI